MSGMDKKTTFSQQLGEKICTLRQSLGFTQKELADKASELLPEGERIYQTDLSTFEKRGERLTSINKIEALLTALGFGLTVSEKKLH